MTARRQRLGREGEEVAARIAARRGLRVLDRRYRCRDGEIDLVAERADLLVFIEVKTRASAAAGRPASGVTARKRRRMARVALHWMQRHDALDRPARFDVVEVWRRPGAPWRSLWWTDAFRPGNGAF